MNLQTLIRVAARIPVTSATLLISLLVFLWMEMGLNYYGLTFLPAKLAFRTGDSWRLITPVFLHFGIMHIVFNSLWIWELGRRIELYAGRLVFLLLFLILALASNWAQYYAIKSAYFGGLSGVVYGYLGFLLVARFSVRHPLLKIPDGLYVVMLVFLVLGFTGVLDVLVGGKVGNAAHLGGLIAGLISGSVFFIVVKVVNKNGNK